MKTGTVIFDLDGTLIDAVKLHGETFVQAFKDFGFDIPFSKVLNLVGMTGIAIATQLANQQLAKKIYDRKTELFFEWFDRFDEIEGATETMNELKRRGNRLSIATSGNNRVMTKVAERFGWTFDLIVTAEDVVRGKPDPEMLNKIKSVLPGPYIFVGDTRFDKATGDAAGVRTLLLGKDLQKLTELLDMKLF
ncbi:MAG: HAD-IA family hydrolase [Candidatus Altiarchaeota archaeon]|nr:HAD-IA family hydrolase [Candidatus Altiarchaeota archaeon]